MKQRLKNDLRRWMTEIIAASIVVIVMVVLFNGVCLSKLLAGLPCPGCGLTRAGLLFLTGDIAGSFQMHPMFVFLLPGFFVFGYERYYKGHKAKYASYYFIGYFIALFLVYLVRMKLYFPGAEPMTYYPGSLLGNGLWRSYAPFH